MATATTQPEPQKLCNHVRTNGNLCQAVAMLGARFCYFHLRDYRRHENLRRAHNLRIARLNQGKTASEIFPLHPENGSEMFDVSAANLFGHMELPLLEDANAIQIAITNILRALALQQVERRTAAVMLYSLQIACSNLKNVRPEPVESIPVATDDPRPLTIYAPGLLPEDEAKEDEDEGYKKKQAQTETSGAPPVRSSQVGQSPRTERQVPAAG